MYVCDGGLEVGKCLALAPVFRELCAVCNKNVFTKMGCFHFIFYSLSLSLFCFCLLPFKLPCPRWCGERLSSGMAKTFVSSAALPPIKSEDWCGMAMGKRVSLWTKLPIVSLIQRLTYIAHTLSLSLSTPCLILAPLFCVLPFFLSFPFFSLNSALL